MRLLRPPFHEIAKFIRHQRCQRTSISISCVSNIVDLDTWRPEAIRQTASIGKSPTYRRITPDDEIVLTVRGRPEITTGLRSTTVPHHWREHRRMRTALRPKAQGQSRVQDAFITHDGDREADVRR